MRRKRSQHRASSAATGVAIREQSGFFLDKQLEACDAFKTLLSCLLTMIFISQSVY